MPKQTKTKSGEVSNQVVINPFNYTVEIVVSTDLHESVSSRNIKVDRTYDAMCSSIANEPFSIIFLPLTVTNAVIAHEALHCVWHIMHIIGAEHENEVMAYTLSWLIEQIEQVMTNARKKLGKK